MPKQLNRYLNNKIVEHLASQYVLGTLTIKVRTRVEKLRIGNQPLELKINEWQEQLSSLDQHTVELPPSEQSWQNISSKLNLIEKDTTPIQEQYWGGGFFVWFSTSFNRLSAGLSAICLVLMTILLFNGISPPIKPDSLSYVAVLTDSDEQAHLVASTYGESQKLVMSVINMPTISSDEDLELWVVSKTDQQARSLGIIPKNTELVEQQLTLAQWRLIKDSDSLIITIEDEGGSPIGEPSELIVSQGLCIQLQEWQKNA